jgi:bis(5'-nucleosyl)-tetraphosphatase (symmetrical)
MRLVDENGRMDFAHKGALEAAPVGWFPWYQLRARSPLPRKIVFGHWAALDGVTHDPRIVALDTGCVWGRALTALCLETGKLSSVLARRR